jgi:cobalt/nickel transport system permease protein
MHLAEGTLPLAHALVYTAVALPAVAWSLRGELDAQRASSPTNILMAGAASLLFAGSLLPLPVPVVGATSHICLTPLIALTLGARRAIWPTFMVLLLQALFFAHGGITTLGVNTLTLGLVGPLVALGCAAALRRVGCSVAVTVAAACVLADLSVYVADAAVLALGLSEAAAPAQTFAAVIIGFAPVQLPLAILEGIISVVLVRTIAERRATLLPPWLRAVRPASMLPSPSAMMVLLAATVGLSGCTYEGIDGSVFGEIATEAGLAPVDSLLDFSGGELGLAMTIVVLFGMGFVAGRSWERLSQQDHALSR